MDKTTAFVLITTILAIISLTFGMLHLESIGCSDRWKRSGYVSEYSFPAGCLVSIDGQWLPEKTIRSLK